MRYPPSKWIHFFSPETRVSLELPSGWTLTEEAHRLAVYKDTRGAHAWQPTFAVRVLDNAFQATDAAQRLAQQLVALPRSQKVEAAHRAVTVDGFTGILDILSYYEEQVAQLLSHYQVFVQVGIIVYSFSGMTLQTQSKPQVSVFDAVIRSVRFIPA